MERSGQRNGRRNGQGGHPGVASNGVTAAVTTREDSLGSQAVADTRTSQRNTVEKSQAVLAGCRAENGCGVRWDGTFSLRRGRRTTARRVRALLEDAPDAVLVEEAQVGHEHVPVGEWSDVVLEVGHVCVGRRAGGR